MTFKLSYLLRQLNELSSLIFTSISYNDTFMHLDSWQHHTSIEFKGAVCSRHAHIHLLSQSWWGWEGHHWAVWGPCKGNTSSAEPCSRIVLLHLLLLIHHKRCTSLSTNCWTPPYKHNISLVDLSKKFVIMSPIQIFSVCCTNQWYILYILS